MPRTILNTLTIVLDEQKYGMTLYRGGYQTAEEFAIRVAETVRHTILNHYNEED